LQIDIERERQRERKKYNRIADENKMPFMDEEPYPERIRRKLIAAATRQPHIISAYDVALMHTRAMMDESPYLGEENYAAPTKDRNSL
jgi:hypothetical protein